MRPRRGLKASAEGRGYPSRSTFLRRAVAWCCGLVVGRHGSLTGNEGFYQNLDLAEEDSPILPRSVAGWRVAWQALGLVVRRFLPGFYARVL